MHVGVGAAPSPRKDRMDMRTRFAARRGSYHYSFLYIGIYMTQHKYFVKHV